MTKPDQNVELGSVDTIASSSKSPGLSHEDLPASSFPVDSKTEEPVVRESCTQAGEANT